jgi:hypothetical protein
MRARSEAPYINSGWRASAIAVAVATFSSLLAAGAGAAEIEVKDSGVGNEYISGQPTTLPAATLSTNLFGPGAQVIRNRTHTAQAPAFDATGRLFMAEPVPTNGFPPYLVGLPYVWLLQNVRHYTNYTCTVKVAHPATFYLLVDNRVNDHLPESPYDDPSLGPPDTQWILDDGWKRVNTGLSPTNCEANKGDYLGIDEGNNGSLNNFYAIYSKSLTQPGEIKLRTEIDGNIYCLVIKTNVANRASAPSSDSKKTASGS